MDGIQFYLQHCPALYGLPVRFLEKAVSGYDFTKTQLTGTVSGF